MCQEPEYTIRILKSLEEFEEIGRLQQLALGIPEDAIFPPKLIYIADENGGTAVGAFDPKGEMVGFVFNFTGSRYGGLIEWSYLLAVAQDSRGHGLRRRLKLAQREEALNRGGRLMCWTIDPLDTEAAAFSFHDLKAVCDEFVNDFPDPVSSRTKNPVLEDRIIARWDLLSDDVVRIAEAPSPPAPFSAETCIVPPGSLRTDSVPISFRFYGDRISLPVPIGLLDIDSAFVPAWRSFVSRALAVVLSEGFRITGFAPAQKAAPDFGWYFLERA